MKPILLDSSKSLTALVNDQSNGLGVLEATECTVEEERNGLYDLTMIIPITAPHFSEVANGSLIRVKVSDGSSQIFRVYQLQKAMNGLVEVSAHHITYDLAKAPVKPFTATGASSAVARLKSNFFTSYPFSITTDIENTSSTFTLDIPRTFRECLGGYSGSILDVFGGVYKWDNLTVRLLASRGSDKGVRIAYGKNLTDINQETNIEAVYDAVVGYASIDEVTYYGNVVYATQRSQPKVKIVDFSEEFDSDATPTKAQLDALAQSYINSNDIGTPRVSIDVEFAPLWQSPEYADIAPLEQVDIDDTVHVYYEALGVEASAKVIRTVWNVLLERFDEVSLGDARTTLSESIVSEAEEKTTEATGFLDSYVNSLTQIIANGLGLFTTRVPAEGGGTKMYLHNRPTLSESQYQWTINSGGFAVSQDYGQTWSAGIDSDGNAVFNSLAANEINALTINGSTINGSTINGTNLYTSNLSTENGIYKMEMWAAVLSLLAGSYYRAALYQTSRGVILELMDGTSTAANDRTKGNTLLMTADSLTLMRVGNSVFSIRQDSNGQIIGINGEEKYIGWVEDGNGHWVIGQV